MGNAMEYTGGEHKEPYKIRNSVDINGVRSECTRNILARQLLLATACVRLTFPGGEKSHLERGSPSVSDIVKSVYKTRISKVSIADLLFTKGKKEKPLNNSAILVYATRRMAIAV